MVNTCPRLVFSRTTGPWCPTSPCQPIFDTSFHYRIHFFSKYDVQQSTFLCEAFPGLFYPKFFPSSLFVLVHCISSHAHPVFLFCYFGIYNSPKLNHTLVSASISVIFSIQLILSILLHTHISKAYNLILKPSIASPIISSTYSVNNNDDMKHPCLTPLPIRPGSNSSPFTLATASWLMYTV